MGKVIGAHLVGSIKGDSAEEVFKKAASALPERLKRLPDGETGERNYWIGFQIPRLLGVAGVSQGAKKVTDYGELPSLHIEPGTEIPGKALGYSDAAIASWEVFQRLQAEGVIEEGTLFQVSLPSPYAVAICWGEFGANQEWMNSYKPALLDEIATICDAIPSDRLSIQVDIAAEVGVLVGAFPADEGYRSISDIAAEIGDVLLAIPEAVDRGVHYCFGDYGHRHFKQPENLDLVVELANAVQEISPADYLHFPADRDSGLNSAYYLALRNLKHDGAEVSLGVIDYDGEPERTDALILAAQMGVPGLDFSVSAECGLARIGERGEGSIEKHLAEHARVSLVR
jgi:hypothetical protein